MNDLINREEACLALDRIKIDFKHETFYSFYQKALTALHDLPSAQPEIIRCKECKHRDPEDKKCDCGHDIRWQLPRQDDWYCADAERRTDERQEHTMEEFMHGQDMGNPEDGSL